MNEIHKFLTSKQKDPNIVSTINSLPQNYHQLEELGDLDYNHHPAIKMWSKISTSFFSYILPNKISAIRIGLPLLYDILPQKGGQEFRAYIIGLGLKQIFSIPDN